jgi:hypothetical protein
MIFYDKSVGRKTGEYGFMVCMGLRMSPRFHIQKSAPPRCFPTHLPRDAKIKVKCVPTIHEEGR